MAHIGTVPITEARGLEVVIEQDHRPVAILRPAHRSGRPVSEILREARHRNSTVTLDEDFGNAVEAIIASQQQPWSPPSRE